MSEKRFSPKLQKYINEKYTPSLDLAVLMFVIALSVGVFNFTKVTVDYIFSKTDFTSFLISALVLVILLIFVIARTRVFNAQNKTKLNQIKRNTFDFNTIQTYQTDTFIIKTIKIILEYKLTRALFGIEHDLGIIFDKTTLTVLIGTDMLDENKKNKIVKSINTEFGSEIANVVSSKNNSLVIDIDLKKLSPQLLKTEDFS